MACHPPPPCPPRVAVEGEGPQRWPQRRLGRQLEEVAKAVGAVTVGYKCHRSWHFASGRQWLGRGWTPQWGGGGGSPPSNASLPPPPPPPTSKGAQVRTPGSPNRDAGALETPPPASLPLNQCHYDHKPCVRPAGGEGGGAADALGRGVGLASGSAPFHSADRAPPSYRQASGIGGQLVGGTN